MKYYDITPLISAQSPVFPGDQAFERHVSMDFSKGDHLGLSSITSTLHIGAHADAPSHYHRQGHSIDQRDLSDYFGSCQVIELSDIGPRRILLDDIKLDEIHAPRVLFKTDSFDHSQSFQAEFSSLSPELIDALAQKGVRLLGIDTPSVDPADSKDLPAHAALFRNDLAVLEGLDLSPVKSGSYQLMALPLKIAGADASPVRAILLPI